jgi:hypothetical protein
MKTNHSCVFVLIFVEAVGGTNYLIFHITEHVPPRSQMQLHPEHEHEQEHEHQPQPRPKTQPKSNLNPSPNRSPIIKITDDEDQQAENAFETLVRITDKSCRYSGPPAAEIEAQTAGL